MNRTLHLATSLLALLAAALGAQNAASGAPAGKRRITIEHALRGRSPIRTTPVASGFRWLPGGKRFLYRPADPRKARVCRYWVQGVAEGKPEPFLDPRKIEQAILGQLASPPAGFRASGYTLGPDLDRLVFRLRDGYLVYDRPSGRATRSAVFDHRGKRHVTLSPGGRHVAYVAGNNLFATDLETGEENRLTEDGSADVLNGVHSWVYFEELYHRNYRAFWWAPDGKHLAFLRFDDTPVDQLTLVDEIPTTFRVVRERYPKAGTPNPGVKLGVVNVENGGIVWMDTGAGPEALLGLVKWTPDGKRVAVEVLNRVQNRLTLVLCDPRTGAGTPILHEENASWIPVKADFRFLRNGALLWPSERDGYRHIYLHGRDGKLVRQLTTGRWTVHRILAVDEKRGRVYFLGDRGSSLERHLFGVGLDGRRLKQLTREPGTHTVTLAPDFEHFIDTYSASDVPRRVLLKHIDGRTIRELGRSEVRGTDRYQVCRPEFFTYRTRDGLTLPGTLLKPPGFRRGRRYPLLLSIYGGPASQGVRNRWQLSRSMTDQALAQMGMIVAKLDHRGAGHLGHAGSARMYGHLGKWEIADYADGVRHLVKQGLVDPERVGIWGWSYGGYVTCMALVTAPDVFRVGVAVAPVTDWRDYDTIYTERYMGLPSENRAGYRDSSVLTHARKLQGQLLIMHGMMDDNVHFQNTVQLARAFIRAGKRFDIMIYPQARHGIGANRARPHLFRTLVRYFATHLLGSRKV